MTFIINQIISCRTLFIVDDHNLTLTEIYLKSSVTSIQWQNQLLSLIKNL